MAEDSPLFAKVSVEESENDRLMDADPLEEACERILSVDVRIQVPDGSPMVVTKLAPDPLSSLDAL
jgi:hypothetical protein